MNPFEARLNRATAMHDNWVRDMDDSRTRAMYRDICAMFTICVLVTGFIWRMAQ